MADDNQINQYSNHPLALTIGKIIANGNSSVVDQEYIPPCISVSASQDLLGLHSELDSFLAGLEQACSQIVQKIYRKSQQNDLSELAQFLCDRIMLFTGQSITEYRWSYIHESPAKMLSTISGLARVLKNTIDLRIGSGKDELMTYLSEWCELNQGELEGLLSNMAALRYNHNDINENITSIIEFAKVIGKLFNTLSNLEFIGKKKESGLFVKEEQPTNNQPDNQSKPKRRFFG
ncbi:MAG: type VI secretion system baseplate subunit TssK [Niabella sp.]